MKKKLTTVEFRGTPEQEEKLLSVINTHRETKGAMMQILQEAQEIYGYLPIEVLKIIARETNTPISEIYGIVSFYSQFSLNPKGEVAVSVCLGTACYVKGSGDVLDRISTILGIKAGETSPDGKFSVEATRCIGACGLAPVITVNNDVYGRLSKKDVDDILKKYM